MNWFYAKDGQQVGPVDFSEIQRLAAEGQIKPDDLVWQQGTPNWVKLSTVVTGGTSPAPSVPAVPGVPAAEAIVPAAPAGARPDYGDFLCWGVIAVIVPCLGFLVYIALMVMHFLEHAAVRKEVAAGTVPESDYSKVHPALFLLGLFCCGIVFYPLFMYWRNQSNLFKQQPYAVWVAIGTFVVSFGINFAIQMLGAGAQAINQ
jgi:hypothetical protein